MLAGVFGAGFNAAFGVAAEGVEGTEDFLKVVESLYFRFAESAAAGVSEG